MRVDAWLAKSAPQKVIDGFIVIDFSDGYESGNRFVILEEALRLIEFYDLSRYRRLQRYIKQITVSDSISAGAMFFLGTTTCAIHPELLTSSVATVASALVHETTHARLDRLGVRQTINRHSRIEVMCLREEVAFARHFPRTPELDEWVQRIMCHVASLERMNFNSARHHSY